ncbi:MULTISPECIES: ACP S-malonyltransferase [Streptomyces]|uniref:Malonyl CoA-acyl carrier protein transacylase n=1 Tax=Streptomyces fimbriatus TaxID=68197 RepID=A0ABW0D286_STRFI
MTVAWVFPGQGAQRQDMGRQLLDRYPDLVARADAILDVPVRDLCRGDDEALQSDTRYVQPGMFVINALHLAALRESGEEPRWLAGHSLGELSALYAAGCFDFETGLRMVVRRGELMAQARGGGMLAVVGLPLERITAVLAAEGATDVDVANLNSRAQVVLSGPRDSLRALRDPLRAGGAHKCVLLNVSIAAHSRYMAHAAALFTDHLRTVDFRPPRVPVVTNADARPRTTAEGLAEHLGAQLRSPVRWADTMRFLIGHGVRTLRQAGPSSTLDKLWEAALADSNAHC